VSIFEVMKNGLSPPEALIHSPNQYFYRGLTAG
jgi:hypothetical protein